MSEPPPSPTPPPDAWRSLPFGDGLACWGTNQSQLHFTGQPQDAETGLNHFQFRQYSSTQGRWLTPDPAGLAAVNPANPQTWNAYAYVGNQPLGATDPLGLNPAGFDTNPNDPCAYISSLGDAGCGQAPGLGLGGFPLFGGVGFGWAGGGGGYGLGGGAVTAAPGPCTAPLCSASNFIAPGGATEGVLESGITIFSVTVEACALNPECVGAIIAVAPEVGLPVAGAALIYAGVKLGIGIYQARSGRNQRENAAAAAALRQVQAICGAALPPNAAERLHRWISGKNLTFGEIVAAGVELFCPEKATGAGQ